MSSEHSEEHEVAKVTDDGLLSEEINKAAFVPIFLMWAVMTVLGVLAGIFLVPHLMPKPYSPEGHDAQLTVQVFTIAAAPVAAFVFALSIYVLFGRRHRGDTPPEDGPPIRNNNRNVIGWLAASTLLVGFLLIWGITEWSVEQSVPPNQLQVNVTGQQWLWTFGYPASGVTSNELVLPVNRPVQFNITSVDVTHGFWPVSMGIQVDANPGQITVIRTTPNKLGKFVVRCSQLCGLNHAYMYAQAKVVSPADYAAWIQQQKSMSSAQALAGGRSNS